jgi:hypothetical protein
MKGAITLESGCTPLMVGVEAVCSFTRLCGNGIPEPDGSNLRNCGLVELRGPKYRSNRRSGLRRIVFAFKRHVAVSLAPRHTLDAVALADAGYSHWAEPIGVEDAASIPRKPRIVEVSYAATVNWLDTYAGAACFPSALFSDCTAHLSPSKVLLIWEWLACVVGRQIMHSPRHSDSSLQSLASSAAEERGYVAQLHATF